MTNDNDMKLGVPQRLEAARHVLFEMEGFLTDLDAVTEGLVALTEDGSLDTKKGAIVYHANDARTAYESLKALWDEGWCKAVHGVEPPIDREAMLNELTELEQKVASLRKRLCAGT